MLKLNLSPSEDAQRVGPVTASWLAPVLTVDAIDYDLSLLEDGATAEHPVLGTVTRTGDDYECTITLRYVYGAPDGTLFPEPIEVTADGEIVLPPYEAEPETTA